MARGYRDPRRFRLPVGRLVRAARSSADPFDRGDARSVGRRVRRLDRPGATAGDCEQPRYEGPALVVRRMPSHDDQHVEVAVGAELAVSLSIRAGRRRSGPHRTPNARARPQPRSAARPFPIGSPRRQDIIRRSGSVGRAGATNGHPRGCLRTAVIAELAQCARHDLRCTEMVTIYPKRPRDPARCRRSNRPTPLIPARRSRDPPAPRLTRSVQGTMASSCELTAVAGRLAVVTEPLQRRRRSHNRDRLHGIRPFVEQRLK